MMRFRRRQRLPEQRKAWKCPKAPCEAVFDITWDCRDQVNIDNFPGSMRYHFHQISRNIILCPSLHHIWVFSKDEATHTIATHTGAFFLQGALGARASYQARGRSCVPRCALAAWPCPPRSGSGALPRPRACCSTPWTGVWCLTPPTWARTSPPRPRR